MKSLLIKTLIFSIFALVFLFSSCSTKRVPIEKDEEIKKEEKSEQFKNAEELFRIGNVELEKFTSIGYREAIKNFEEALEIDPKFYKVYARLALSYALWAKERKELGMDNMEQWVRAKFYADKAEEFLPSDDSKKAMAMVYASKNFMTEMEYGTLFRWSQFLLRRDDKERVISYLKDIYSSNKFKRETMVKAIKILKDLLTKNPEDTEAMLFVWWMETPGYECEEIKKVMERRPDWVIPYFEMASYKKKIAEMEKAEEWLKEVLKRNPEHPRALSELGEIALSKGNTEEAMALLKKALSFDSELPNTHFILGTVYHDMGENEDAFHEFLSSHKLRPDWEDPLYKLSLLLIEDRKWEDAIETALDPLIDLYGSFEIYAYTYRALCFLMTQKLDEAEEDCHQAIKINSNFDIPYFILGMISLEKGEYRRARERFLQCLKINDYNADAHYNLGLVYIKLKKEASARAELKKAKKLFLLQLSEIDKKIKEAQRKGKPKKVERLSKEKEELEKKISQCEYILSSSIIIER